MRSVLPKGPFGYAQGDILFIFQSYKPVIQGLAEKLGISESNITNWKNGENLPSVDILYKLCKLLNESADYLLGLDDEK